MTDGAVAEARADFGRRVRNERTRRGLSQAALGAMSGLPQRRVSDIEHGWCGMQRAADGIAAALGIPSARISSGAERHRAPANSTEISRDKAELPATTIHASARIQRDDGASGSRRGRSEGWRALAEMIRGGAFSGYALARKDGAGALFLMDDGSWGAEVTPRIRLFNRLADARFRSDEIDGSMIFYADFAFAPLSGAE